MALTLIFIITSATTSIHIFADQVYPEDNGYITTGIVEDEDSVTEQDPTEYDPTEYEYPAYDSEEYEYELYEYDLVEYEYDLTPPLMPLGMARTATFMGSGTAQNPFIINNALELEWLAHFVNTNNTAFNASHYILSNDINISGRSWTPIGINSANSFRGVFDGNGHQITGLFFDRSASDFGLFGHTINATIRNLGVTEMNVRAGNNIGGIVGLAVNTDILNSYTSGSIRGVGYIGGIVGRLNGGNISNCFSLASVTGTYSFIGGIAGQISGSGIVRNTYATGSVSGLATTGGLVGAKLDTSRLENSVALNPSVRVSTQGISDIHQPGRVFGHSSTSGISAARNHGLSTMTNGGGGRPLRTPATFHNLHNAHNGADITPAQSISASFWSTSTPQFTAFDPQIWHITDGALPTLRNPQSPVPERRDYISMHLTAGTSQQLSVTRNINQNTDFNWVSSDTSVASVLNGLVTAASSGYARITASDNTGFRLSIYVVVEGSIPQPQPTTRVYNDNHANVRYSGAWLHHGNDPRFFQDDQQFSNQPGAYAEFTFYGTGVEYIAALSDNLGVAHIYLNGERMDRICAFIDTDYLHQVNAQQVLWSIEGLAQGHHTLRIVVAGEQHGASLGSFVTVDAFRVTSYNHSM